MPEFSDYIVYVDESGDHGLTNIDPEYPAFCLSFCIFHKEAYREHVCPAMQAFKFRYWGHDSVVLHEHEIRKSKGDFTFLLTDADVRTRFQEDLSAMIDAAPMEIIAATIHKEKLVAQYARPFSPYDIAMKFCLERLLLWLRARDQERRSVHVIFEGRGKNEDDELKLSFLRVVAGQDKWGWVNRNFQDMEFVPVVARKAANSAGLQLADLTARPIALKMLRPAQLNRAYEIIERKLAYRKDFP